MFPFIEEYFETSSDETKQILYDKNGLLACYQWRKQGLLRREDGPAVIYAHSNEVVFCLAGSPIRLSDFVK